MPVLRILVARLEELTRRLRSVDLCRFGLL